MQHPEKQQARGKQEEEHYPLETMMEQCFVLCKYLSSPPELREEVSHILQKMFWD